MKIRQVVSMLNRMRSEGVFERYAIGGAVAATVFIEPIATLDIDVFVPIEPKPGEKIATLSSIFEYLTPRGGRVEGEYIVIADWLVQFLPASGPLLAEAVEEAIEIDLEGELARVIGPEHLAAIALQTGRAKDKARYFQFLESGILDLARLEAIVRRHGLTRRWQHYGRQFEEGDA